ncbi:MAG: hypothetical protein EA357_02310 [Micavibrio sp.]|nr:MAG: hypothetical protein EA357_02310 [Micavibrio sp.]
MNDRQSTDHILLIEPKVFFTNPETAATNPYQNMEAAVAPAELLVRVREEIHGFAEALRHYGIKVTILPGSKKCPDHIFPGNWVSTHPEKTLVYYPMMAKNRRAERTKEICAFLENHYTKIYDYAPLAEKGTFLEGTGSFALDRAHRIAYMGISQRSHVAAAEQWAKELDYELVTFRTALPPDNLPVYHTDLLMFIGYDIAAVCFEAIPDEKERKAVRVRLSDTHDLVDLSLEQMHNMCGNALELRGDGGIAHLVMSTRAYKALTKAQKQKLLRRYVEIIHTPLDTIEEFGGGSARCLILELF